MALQEWGPQIAVFADTEAKVVENYREAMERWREILDPIYALGHTRMVPMQGCLRAIRR